MNCKEVRILLTVSIISSFIACNIFNPENQQENDVKLSESFSCYPNPFGNAEKPTTIFTYYLSEASDIQIKIYTQYKKIIWKCHYNEQDSQGKKGIHHHDIMWDGRDEQGEKVVSGIYDAYILTNNGKKYATTTISILR